MSGGLLGEALDGFVAGIAAYEANGDVNRSFTLRIYHAFLLVHLHDNDEALRLLDDTLAGIQAGGHTLSPNEMRIELIVRGMAQLGLGMIDAAMASLMAARNQLQARSTLSSWYWRLALQWALTDVHLVSHDLASARTYAQAFLASACATEERTWRGIAWEASARVALACGEISAAQICVARGWNDIEGYDTPLARWRLHAVEVLLAQAAGDKRAAQHHGDRQRQEITALVATLPTGHAGRASLAHAKLIMPVLHANQSVPR